MSQNESLTEKEIRDLITGYENDARQLRSTSDFEGADLCYKEIKELQRELYHRDMIEEDMIKPKYCPHCGARLVDDHGWIQAYLDNYDISRVQGYDCYCDNCTWSGNIEPDTMSW